MTEVTHFSPKTGQSTCRAYKITERSRSSKCSNKKKLNIPQDLRQYDTTGAFCCCEASGDRATWAASFYSIHSTDFCVERCLGILLGPPEEDIIYVLSGVELVASATYAYSVHTGGEITPAGPQPPASPTGSSMRDLRDFLLEADLGEYHAHLGARLKVTTIEHLKYVREEDLEEIGMTRPEMRRLKKFYRKEFPSGAIGKLRKIPSPGDLRHGRIFLVQAGRHGSLDSCCLAQWTCLSFIHLTQANFSNRKLSLSTRGHSAAMSISSLCLDVMNR
ncbi:hypothetical protein RRG08_017725 [Elysia crispata]|uniref:non-specific protein-tyrosine kinase n=1 Tax=Elysia crispata TaxID=231223 RepID=A0AAE1CKJ9_9GAST|nr:hypothetical protein RRG08_017725 [Elysia crispata]